MAAQPKEVLRELLLLMGFDAAVEEHRLDEGILLEVQTDESGRLIGRQGQTLSDLQYVLNRLLFQQDPETPKITVDVGSYRAQAREALVSKAKAAAEKVRRWGDVVELEPMNAFDRRIVHNVLKDDPGVRVEQYTGLTVDFVRQVKATAILRGIRDVSDLRYEFQLALANRAVGGVETVFIMAGDQFALTSSSLIRQVVALGGDVRQLKGLLPDIIVEWLQKHKMPKAAPDAPPE